MGGEPDCLAGGLCKGPGMCGEKVTGMDKTIRFKEHFRLLEHDQNGSILKELLRLPRRHPLPEVQFLNYYKEVPVFSPARIVYLFGDTLICHAGEAQARAIGFSKGTVVRAAPLKHDVYATAHYDPVTREVALSDFCYVEVLSERRASIRVRMQAPPEVVIEAGPGRFTGRMLDLSLYGCAIEIADREPLGGFTYFYINLETPLKARLMSRLMRVEGDTRQLRCIFLFEHDRRSEDQIGRLIARRQAEIIRELTT